jgi:hypothetical protein
MSTDYGDLSTTDLAKQINDEYAVILTNERTNLQRALSVGEKLIALRPRIAPKHGDWQAKLKVHCREISYETANLYIRFVENFDKLEAYAASKSVTITDLTIQEARAVLTKSSNKSGQPTKVVKGGVEEPGNEPQPASVAPDVALEGLANDEIFDTLRNVYHDRQADLLDLVARLAGSLGMRLTALPETAEAYRELAAE